MSQPNSNVVLLPFDKSATFTGQLGRYYGGSSYDRLIYNELFNETLWSIAMPRIVF